LKARNPARKKGPPRIKAVIFDYGGTLFRSKRPWSEVKARGLAAAYETLRTGGLESSLQKFVKVSDAVFEEFEKAEAKEDRDIPDRTKYLEVVERLLPDLPKAKKSRLAGEANRAFWKVATETYPMRKSAKPALKHIQSKGLRMGILSNHHNYESLVSHLQDSGIHGHFEVVLASEKEGIRKPNTEIFERSLKALGVESHEAIFVGDSPRHDIVGARSSGITTVLIDDGGPRDSWTHPEGLDPDMSTPDYVIADLAELRGIVDSLSASSPRRTKKRG